MNEQADQACVVPSWREADRLAALRRYEILDTPRETAFDDVAELAGDIFDAPIAVVNFIADGRQWFKAEVGIGQRELPLDVSICRHAILQPGVFVVPDLACDRRFEHNPLVAVGGGLRFYAGALLATPNGLPLGTVCVLDTKPRPDGISERQKRALETLASQTMAQLELRRSEAALRQSEARLRFLDRLGAETASLADADAVLATTTRLLGEELNLSVCAYADMDADENGFTIRGDWAAPGSQSIVGHYRLADFGKLAVENLSAGLPLIVNDNLAELAPEEAAAFRGIGIAATLCMPLVKEGRLTALMAIHDRVPRVWTDAELSLLREVTARSWAHVERVGATAELRDREARLRAVFDQAAAGFARVDLTGRFSEVNDRYCAIVGQTRENLLTLRMQDLTHPEDLAATLPLFETAAAGGPAFEIEKRYLRPDGSTVWVRNSVAPVRAASGEVDAILVVSVDISERKRAEEELRQLNETLESRVVEALAQRKLWADVFETTDAKIAALDPRRCFIAVNRAYADEFEKIFGPRPAIGDCLADLLAELPNERAAALAVWDRALSGQAFVVTEEFGDPARARPYYELRFNPLHDRDGRLIGAFQYGIDVTRRLRAQADLAQAQAALRQSQKMDSLGQMVGGIAHDFNNLLTGIIGALDLLERRVSIGRTENLERYTTTALASAKRAAALTQRLLAFSRRQALDPKPTDLNAVVRSMEDLVRRSVGEGVTVETAVAGGLWATKVDRSEIENALLNLCVNARDAMPEGGRLTIETSNGHLDDAYAARHADVRPGQYAVLSVTDTGIGMPPDVIERIFEPFWTTKPIGKGTGLGLSQLFGFVKQSGGHVAVYSEVGQGTTFKVYLPRHRGAVVEDAGEGSAELPRAGDQQAVLVVEDEDTVRMLVLDVLDDLGYEAHEAVDADGALRVLESDVRIDLLVTDVGLPGLNGRQLADRARELRPDLKILFITGYAHNAAVGNGLLEPGMEVVTKPFAVDRLATKIASMVTS